MLKTADGLFFVHSLNQGSWESVPGFICINQRDTWKKGYSFEALLQPADESDPSLIWKSKFGSVTFNPFGMEFPDGGMNEAGLFIWEMSFDAEYSTDETKPTLFQMQWMQYQLDKFSTVDEVIESADRINLDGWGWHYFVADKSGKTAIIDYLNGKPEVYSGDDMPVPICCNSAYSVAMEFLKQHKNFGGDLEIEKNYEEIPRFIYGAKLMQEYASQDPIKYSFYMLDEMSKNVRWSVVFDVNNMTAYFNTNLNKEIRHFSFSSDDFEVEDGPLTLDIECPGPENVRTEFAAYDREKDKPLMKGLLKYFVDESTDFDLLTESIMDKVQFPDNSFDFDIQGDWIGTVKHPSSDGWTELPMTLVLRRENGVLSGTVNDGEVVKELPISNALSKGGLLYFTVKDPDTEDVYYYQLYVSTNGIRGAVETWDWENRKKAPVNLQRR